MLLRKINAVLSLVSTVLILVHAVFYAVWMMFRGSIAKLSSYPSRILVVLVIVHAIISIALGVMGHKSAEKTKSKSYSKLNILTVFQRISGIMLILLIGFHIVGAMKHFQPKLLHAIVHPLFFIIALMHVAISTSKAFITLGVGNSKAIKIIDIVVKVICLLTILTCIVGFYLCLFVGVGK